MGSEVALIERQWIWFFESSALIAVHFADGEFSSLVFLDLDGVDFFLDGSTAMLYAD
jgi:hypothetical protein